MAFYFFFSRTKTLQYFHIYLFPRFRYKHIVCVYDIYVWSSLALSLNPLMTYEIFIIASSVLLIIWWKKVAKLEDDKVKKNLSEPRAIGFVGKRSEPHKLTNPPQCNIVAFIILCMYKFIYRMYMYVCMYMGQYMRIWNYLNTGE